MDPVTTLPWIVAYGVVAVCIIFSNLLMTAVFTKSPAVRRMRTAMFLMGMTAADLIVGVVAIPMYMALLWPGSRLGGEFADSYMSIEMVSSFASLFLLVVIALERVYSVFRPYRHRGLSRTPYWVGLFMSWFMAGVPVAFIPDFFPFISSWQHILLLLAFMAAVPTVIVVSCVAIWLKLKTTRVEGLHQRRDLQERKMARTLAMLTGVFLVTWLPFSIVNTLVRIDVDIDPILQGLSLKVSFHILYASKVLHYSNSFMNPVIYSFRISQVRSALGKIFHGHSDAVAAPGGLQMGLRRRDKGGAGGGDEGGCRAEGGEGGVVGGGGVESREGVVGGGGEGGGDEEGAEWEEERAKWEEERAKWEKERAKWELEGRAKWELEGRAEWEEERAKWELEGRAEWEEERAKWELEGRAEWELEGRAEWEEERANWELEGRAEWEEEREKRSTEEEEGRAELEVENAE